jgi:hypothetical protein
MRAYMAVSCAHTKHVKAKGHNYAQMEPRAGSLISDPILTKSTVQDMESCK